MYLHRHTRNGCLWQVTLRYFRITCSSTGGRASEKITMLLTCLALALALCTCVQSLPLAHSGPDSARVKLRDIWSDCCELAWAQIVAAQPVANYQLCTSYVVVGSLRGIEDSCLVSFSGVTLKIFYNLWISQWSR